MPVATSYDPDFLAGLNSVVSVELDLARDGSVQDRHGDPVQNYRPVPGQEAVPVRLVIRQPSQAEQDARTTASLNWTVLSGSALIWDVGHRLAYQDPGAGRTRYGYVQAQTYDAHQMGHHWVTKCVEVVV